MEKKHMGTTCKSFAALAAFGLAFALTLAPLTAHAQQATNGQNGGNGSGIRSGANGANGSDGVLLSGVTSVAGGTFTAGSGGNGGSGGSGIIDGINPSGGSGGTGGSAAVAQAGATVTVTGGAFTAGSGGNGGGGDIFGGSGGRGGGGGSALVALAGSTVTVTGGTFSVGSNGSSGGPYNSGGGGHAGYDLLASGGAITVYGSGFSPGSVGPSLTGSGTFTATIGGVTQTLSYSVSSAAGSALFLKNSGTLATTTGLTVSPNTSVTDQSVTLTAAVTSNDPTLGTPTGSVTFQMGSTLLGTVPLTNGTATLTTNALPLGSDTLTAYYSGDSSFAGSSGSFVQTVNSGTRTSLTSNFNPSFPGQSVTFTAAVTAADSSTPTGAVQFAIDGANVGGPVTLNASGKASDTETGLAVGAHTVTVTYAPTGAFVGNVGASLTQTVYPPGNSQYVSPSGSDSNNGSQASPKQTIQAAVNATQSGDTVIVEDGTYSGNGNRDIDFAGRNITVRSASGDPTRTIIDCGGSRSAIHRGFFFHSGEKNAVVSGLTIQLGYESTYTGSNSSNPGGSGGAAAVASGSVATLTNCTFHWDASDFRGGAVYNDGTLTLTGCAFAGNTTTGTSSDGGGGLYNLGTVSATNCAFAGNRAISGYGGAITNSGPAVFVGCTITANIATAQGGSLFNNGALTLTDDIVYGDTGGEIAYNGGTASVTYCDVQGGYAGTGNINADPLFVNAPLTVAQDLGDLHLQPGSPCLGAGTPSGAPPTDKDGTLRPTPPSIGAYDALYLAALSVPSPVPGGTVVTATVTLSAAPPTDAVVGLASSDSSVVRVHRAVVVPAGSRSVTFPITTYPGMATQSVAIQATLGPVVLTAPLTILGQ